MDVLVKRLDAKLREWDSDIATTVRNELQKSLILQTEIHWI